jgi:tripartite-type tricarboxylate transporter receptor subunit TctC
MFILRPSRSRSGLVLAAAALLTGLVLNSPPAAADAYPSRPIHVLVGFGPGGGMDLLARIVGQKLSEQLKQPVVIDNKPGAGAMLAAELEAHAAPDGYTLLVAPNSTMVINPAVYTKLAYSPRTDFAPISMLASIPCVLVVRAGLAVKSAGDLVAYAKAHPANANASGSSASFQLATEMFKLKTGAPFTYVSYKSTNEAVEAVMSGEVLAGLLDAPPVAPQLAAGTLRALAVASPRREPLFANVPTLEEQGIHGAEINLWGGLFAPAATPRPVIDKLQGEVASAMKDAGVRQRLAALRVEPVGDSSAEFARFIAAEVERWTAVAKSAHISIEP